MVTGDRHVALHSPSYSQSCIADVQLGSVALQLASAVWMPSDLAGDVGCALIVIAGRCLRSTCLNLASRQRHEIPAMAST